MAQPERLPHLQGNSSPVGICIPDVGNRGMFLLLRHAGKIKVIEPEGLSRLVDLPILFGLGQEVEKQNDSAVVSRRALLCTAIGNKR